MKIMLFGGSGTLGQKLLKINPSIISPTHNEVNVDNFDHLWDYINDHRPDIIIHAAALTDNRIIERNPRKAIQTNIVGTSQVAMACYDCDIRLVYISTDYIYKGDRGNYKETDEILPFNIYAWTKLGGECAVKGVKNHLIIRTSFGKSFSYRQAFVDKWTNKDYVERIAPMIYDAAVSPMTGVLNLGTKRKTLYDHAVEANQEVKGVRLEETHFNTPVDSSMNLQKWINYADPIAKPHTACRICGNTNLEKYLDLGLMPLSNNLEFTAERARNQERFPLQVMFCPECGLSQLSVVVSPRKMYDYYTYRSSINAGYVKHCRQMAKEMKARLGLTQDSYMIDIAGNDGTLLKEFKEEIGLNVLNIDPASNLTAIAKARGIPSMTEFWSMTTAQKCPQVDLITATNVFAHVDDVGAFLKACDYALKPDGVLVFEFPYLSKLIRENQYDTVYFEHLSYFLIHPIIDLCNQYGFLSTHIDNQDIHGGTVRIIIYRANNIQFQSVVNYKQWEKSDNLLDIDTYKRWAVGIKKQISDFTDQILKLKKEGSKIVAFAASAKGNTLLNSAGISTDIVEVIIDETPEKIGKFSPGTGIPIVGLDYLNHNQPDYILILSWNFKEEIMEKCRKTYTGKFIIPIPEFSIIS